MASSKVEKVMVTSRWSSVRKRASFYRSSVVDFTHDDHGASLPEYALLLVLIAAPALLVLPTVGTKINNMFQGFVTAF